MGTSCSGASDHAAVRAEQLAMRACFKQRLDFRTTTEWKSSSCRTAQVCQQLRVLLRGGRRTDGRTSRRGRKRKEKEGRKEERKEGRKERRKVGRKEGVIVCLCVCA